MANACSIASTKRPQLNSQRTWNKYKLDSKSRQRLRPQRPMVHQLKSKLTFPIEALHCTSELSKLVMTIATP